MTTIDFCSQLLSLENSLLKFAYRFNLKRADAKDLVQETFLKVLMRRDQYVDNEKFKAWAFTIMRNTFVDNYRRNLSHNTTVDQTSDSYFINQADLLASDDPASEYSVIEINRNIEQLSEKFRVPFQMFIDGYKYTEIAEELDIKLGTVKSRIFLSRKLLMENISR
jgi:RNA polymerase sigma factor (sigma-70 family)